MGSGVENVAKLFPNMTWYPHDFGISTAEKRLYLLSVFLISLFFPLDSKDLDETILHQVFYALCLAGNDLFSLTHFCAPKRRLPPKIPFSMRRLQQTFSGVVISISPLRWIVAFSAELSKANVQLSRIECSNQPGEKS